MASLTTGQDLTSLIMRATNPLNQDDDPNLVQAVCQEVGNDISKIQIAIRLIVHKMQSPHEREALQALLVLQACINNCGPNFHSEVGKFRFLNEMIKLVSPKYYGNQTPEEVKKRVVELLYTWTLDLKSEPKIAEAYDMLKKQGVVKEDPHYLGATPTQCSSKAPLPASFEDEKKSRLLQRLLQSKKPEDISKANALIKHMVKEDERRMERSSRRIVEVETAINNVKVLDEMLTQYNQSTSVKSADMELMEELYSSCQSLRANIYRIVSEMEDKEDGIGELLKASDELSRVMGRYKLETEGKTDNPKGQTNTQTDVETKAAEEDTLLDLSSDVEVPPQPPRYSNSESLKLEELGIVKLTPSPDHLSDLTNLAGNDLANLAGNDLANLAGNDLANLAGNDLANLAGNDLANLAGNDLANLAGNDLANLARNDHESLAGNDLLNLTVKKESILEELEDVFSDSCLLGKPSSNGVIKGLDSHLLNNNIMQQPISPLISSQPILDTLVNKSKTEESPKLLNDLDFLGSSLLRESLPRHIDPIGSQFKTQEKVSLNQMKQKSKISESTVKSTTSQSACLVDENFLQKCSTEPSPNSIVSSLTSELELISDLVPSSVETNIEKASPKLNSKATQLPQDVSSLPLLNAKNEPEKPKLGANVQLCEVKPLHNINVTLEEIKPGKQSSVVLMESNGMSVVLHFTDNRPRDDVSIIVVTVTSQNSRPISNYVLQAVGPKGCKVKLQSPSSTTLAEYSPFLPPPAITQIMLIANPNQLNVSLKVMLSYTIDDEAVTDMGEIDKLPL